MVLSGIISFFVLRTVYEAKTTLIVNTEKQDEQQVTTGGKLNVTQKLAITYGEIIKSRAVLTEVIDDLKLGEKYEDLSNKISVEPVKDTQIISISMIVQPFVGI